MKISVIIPTRNRQALLHRTLQALNQQIGAPEFEVCVTDNGSSDETARTLAAGNLNYRLHSIFEPVANRALARNRAIALAGGDLLVFIDDDVLVPPNFLAAHAAAHADGQPRTVTGPILQIRGPAETPTPRWFHHSRAFFCTCNASVPTAALESVGAFDDEFSGYGWEDTELGVRLRGAGLSHAFAWAAFVYHLKPLGWESLAAAAGRMREKGTMARRFVRKCDTWRVRLATGDYAVNHWRGALFGGPWSMAPARALALSEHAPALLRGLARSHYLDGVYRAALRGDTDLALSLGSL